VAKIIERARAGYEVKEVAYSKVYTWRPESVVVECECGQETALTQAETACEGCGAEHTGIVREHLSDRGPQGDEEVHLGATTRGTAKTTERCRTEEALGLVT
jgi:hypothetical protein